MHTTPAVKFKGDYLVLFLPQKGFQNICIAFFMGGKKILVEEKNIGGGNKKMKKNKI